MAYDSTHTQTVMFGGNGVGQVTMGGLFPYLNDTWLWNGSDWSEATPQAAPAPRSSHAMAYASGLSQLVLFRGVVNSNVGLARDTWVWNGSNWIEQASSLGPSERYGHTMVNTSGIINTVAHGFFGTCTATPQPVANSDVAATGLAVDSGGNLFIADKLAECIQELSNGTVTTFAGIPITTNIGEPWAVAFDSSGNLYIAEGSVVLRVGAQVTPPANPPSFTESGVVNGASFQQGGVVPGEIATIFGSNLTSSTGINLSSSLPLPAELQNVSVTVNGTPAPIFAVDNVNGQQQINFQVPWATQSIAKIQVTNRGAASSVVLTPVQVSQPAIFNYSAGGDVFGAILHSNFKLANTADPAAGGETVLIYCTGLGYVVAPLPANGVAATGQPTMNAPTVTIGGANARVSFSGLAPGYVGLYQVNAQVPAGLAAGNQPVVITIAGSMSKSVLLPVH
jgi:uncharacterized protein (TIGR03437 family)